jgi:indole-3-glycerol phosphate synthase
MSADFLAAMAHASRERVTRAREHMAPRELRARALAAPTPPRLRLSPQGFDLIGEVKLRSPAAGQLSEASEDIGARAAIYADAGAAAISVLTEPSRFDGELAHVSRAAQRLHGRIPVMRKDFLVDPYQVYEARLAGAGGVLVILRMLARAQIEALLDATVELGLFALLEAFDESDLQLAAELVQHYSRRALLLVGVNCRDLVTLEVVPGRLEALAALLPAGVPRVAESGVATGADAARLAAQGYDVALVGSALMQAADPLGLAAALLAAGRAAAAARTGAGARA